MARRVRAKCDFILDEYRQLDALPGDRQVSLLISEVWRAQVALDVGKIRPSLAKSFPVVVRDLLKPEVGRERSG